MLFRSQIAHAVHPVCDLQIEYSLISRGPEERIFPVLRELGIGVTAYGVLSRGLLSGSAIAGKGDIRNYMPRFTGSNREGNQSLIDTLGRLAADKGVAPAQLAVALSGRPNDVRQVDLDITPAGTTNNSPPPCPSRTLTTPAAPSSAPNSNSPTLPGSS